MEEGFKFSFPCLFQTYCGKSTNLRNSAFSIEEGNIKCMYVLVLGPKTCCREWRRSIIDEYDKVCSSAEVFSLFLR